MQVNADLKNENVDIGKEMSWVLCKFWFWILVVDLF